MQELNKLERIVGGAGSFSRIKHRLSQIFQPITNVSKETVPKNTDVTSHSQKLMLDLGVIRASNPGSFHFLPLGVRALQKLIDLVDAEMLKIGAQKIILSTLTNASLWEKSGRYDGVEPELFTLNDRHDRTYILSPTHEEAASDLIASLGQISYRNFPLKLYQITNKFRDEMKPRFGLMRGRQFLMKDLYTFDVDVDSAKSTYRNVCESYDGILNKIGIDYVKVLGAPGKMGGNLSHEYHYLASVGEDRILTCSNCNFAANVEVSGGEGECPQCKKTEGLQIITGIEIGHTFLLGDKYSKPLKATYLANNGKSLSLQMGSYGLGLSRLIAAAVEVLSTEQEMRWPNVLAPFHIVIIPPKMGSKEEETTRHLCAALYNKLETMEALKDNILLDDRTSLTIGKRVLEARRVGYPLIIAIGGKATENPPLYELFDLGNNRQLFFTETELLNYIDENFTKQLP